MTLLQDLRFAARVLLRKPAFTVVALLTLGLAIGANTAIFSIVNALVLRPLPFPEPEEIVQLERGYPDGKSTSVAAPKFVFWREHNTVFEHVATYDTLGSGFNMTGDGPPERVTGSRVSVDFFKVQAQYFLTVTYEYENFICTYEGSNLNGHGMGGRTAGCERKSFYRRRSGRRATRNG
jgi:hypothetical protein